MGDIIQLHWPLYYVFPACTAGFYVWYLVSPMYPALLPRAYAQWHELDKKCWRQNTASAVHSLIVVSSLIGIQASDPEIAIAGLSPYYNWWLYVTASISLAFFSLAFPWSLYMYFFLKARQPYTRLSLCVHHMVVVSALLVYLLTQYCPHQGALAILLMEITNWFYVPHLLLTQLGHKGTLWTANGICFVIAYTSCRIFACTWLAIQMVIDVARFNPPQDVGWAAISVSLGSLYVLLYLSFFWFIADVAPTTHNALKDLLGEDYHRRCCPAKLRALASHHSAAYKREQSVVRAQVQWLREMKAASNSEPCEACTPPI